MWRIINCVADKIELTDLQSGNDSVLVLLHSIVRELGRRKQTHTLQGKVSTSTQQSITGSVLRCYSYYEILTFTL